MCVCTLYTVMVNLCVNLTGLRHAQRAGQTSLLGMSEAVSGRDQLSNGGELSLGPLYQSTFGGCIQSTEAGQEGGGGGLLLSEPRHSLFLPSDMSARSSGLQIRGHSNQLPSGSPVAAAELKLLGLRDCVVQFLD